MPGVLPHSGGGSLGWWGLDVPPTHAWPPHTETWRPALGVGRGCSLNKSKFLLQLLLGRGGGPGMTPKPYGMLWAVPPPTPRGWFRVPWRL